MTVKFLMLWTDVLLYLLLIVSVLLIFYLRNRRDLRQAFARVFQNRIALVAFMFFITYVVIGVLDSIHYHPQIGNTPQGQAIYSTQISSVLDTLLPPMREKLEKTYSAPFAHHLYVKEVMTTPTGEQYRAYPALQHVQAVHVEKIILSVCLKTIGMFISLFFILSLWQTYRHRQPWRKTLTQFVGRQKLFSWRLFFLTLLLILFLIQLSVSLATHYHVFGTDKIGQDVFYAAIKSIRTGLLIGTLTTLIMLPFAILLGIAAGYFGGFIDDVIQYVYTTLSSIPGVLLIAAAILSLQVYINTHPQFFPTLAQHADARLLALCAILGMTSWTSLCRLLRGESLKLREIDYIKASRALGVGHFKILLRHILPNVMHIVLIAVVLDFSSLVLAEAVLSYVGVGVDPTTMSWGNMINSARLELARDPIVWWPLCAAFIMMFSLVLAANLFADAVREAFDPRLH